MGKVALEPEITYIECACSSAEHVVRICVENDPDAPFIWLAVQLAKHNFLSRVWNAVKYIFGYECKYGHWDEVVINETEAKKIINKLENFLGFYENQKSGRKE